jgi:CubicO group peptidase (beta-lactamase class C family)
MREGQKTLIFRTAVLLAVAFLYGVTSHAQVLTERLDDYVKTVVKRTQFSGTVLVMNDDRVLLSKGFGMANLEHGEPNTIKTTFRIGSLTKQFTAVAILMLQERGSLNLQDSICRYLPQCPVGWEQITIHHLLTHTSGLPDASYVDKVELPLTADKAMAYLRNKPLRFAPGARFSYGSSNYILLGYIIEKASRESYEAFLRENILGPRGLTNTGYDHQESAVKNLAAGYSLRGEILVNASHVEMSMPFAAGGLYSTTEDLYRWMQALGQQRLLSARSLALMWTPFQGHYGYGWYVGRLLDRRFVYHGGWIHGFAAAIACFPDKRITAIVLSNVDSAPVNTMARDLAAIVIGAVAQNPSGHQAMKINPAIYDDYVGRYELSSGILIVLTRENNKLIGRATGYPAIELLPESETVFFVKELGARITFVREDRLATHFILHWDQQELTARRVQDAAKQRVQP